MNVVSSEYNRFNPRAGYGEANNGSRGFGLRYPSPFFDIAQQFLPTNVHQLHEWCRYYFLTNPVINVVCSKMAEYPVTPLLFDTTDEKLQKLYKGLERILKLRELQVEIGLDYFVYGNCFISVYFPLEKFIICKSCQSHHRVRKSKHFWKWRSMKFHLKCPECGHEGVAKEKDVYLKNIRDTRVIRWNPENISIKYNEFTGKYRYFLKVPRSTVNDVKLGDPQVLGTLPAEIIDAVRKNKHLEFSENNIYHLKRPTIAQKDQGWGTPLIYPLLKDAFYLQVMKKANEAIFMEHIVPMRMIFPGANTGGNDGPFGSYNLTNWKRKIDEEINIWKRDPNYIPILPVNVGYQHIGGQGKSLLMFQEYKMLAEQMVVGAGVPVEFIFGGLQWSGSSTSLRALENVFLGYNMQRHDLVNNFIIKRIAGHMEFPVVESRFGKFKMADDLQRAMFYSELNSKQKISDRRLMEEIGENFDLEQTRMEEELRKQNEVNRKMQVTGADIQGAAQLRQARYQTKIQEIQAKAQMEQQLKMQEAQMKMQEEQQKAQQAAQAQQHAEAAKAQEQAQRYAMQIQQYKLESERLKVEGDRAETQTAKTQIPIAKERAERAEARADEAQARAHNTEVKSVSQSGMPIPDPERENAPIRQVPGATMPVPGQMQSSLSSGQMGQVGIPIEIMAKRAAAYLRQVAKEKGDQAMYQDLEQMKTSNPNLHSLVVSALNSKKGDQTNPMNAAQNPNPTSRASPGRQVVA